MTNPTPEQIAAGLTKAQRDAIVSAEPDGQLGKCFIRWWQAGTKTMASLRRKQLATTVWSGVVLSDTGLQVRAILRGEA